MKKILVFAVILGLLVPAAAFAAAEFSLGGFVKLDAFWDSTQQGKNLNGVVLRNNDPNFHHGQTRFTAQGSRFNFTIKGPKAFGAQVTGFMEMDFDQQNTPDVASASSVYTPRMRHAMFRLNWPTTELLFGQYWSLFCSWYAEAAEDGPLQATGTPTARLPQIRYTQKFMSDWAVMALVGMANSAVLTNNTPYSVNSNNGSATETPQIQASLKYEHDWWGKAAYYGAPTPLTIQVMGGWQRAIARTGANAVSPFNTTYNGAGALNTLAVRNNNNYTDPWMAMGSFFIPVIPTHSANLAGTASILTQWWMGQGVQAFGFNGDGTAVFKLNNNLANGQNPLADVELVKRWGGFVQGQYYFNNQWFMNVAYGITHTWGVDQSVIRVNGVNVSQYGFNGVNAQINSMQQIDATLWYRPIQALKFGLQYSYAQANFWTRLGGNAAGNAQNVNFQNEGGEHRVEFAGYFFF
jgi:hypothetical protein